MKLKSRKKKWLLAALVLVLAAALGAGIWFFTSGSRREPVPVYSFRNLGMTEYWGDSRESYGPVTTDRIQTVFLSDTQIVKEIYVRQGDQVKKGDILMSFDTTLSDLALERKRLDVEKLKLQLEDAKDRLQEIKNMRPMRLPAATPQEPEDEESLGRLLEGSYEMSMDMSYDGSSADKALICWVSSAKAVDTGILEAAWETAVHYQTEMRDALWEEPSPRDPETGDPEGADPEAPGEADPETPEPEAGPVEVTHFYLVIRVTQSNRILGGKTTWQGIHVYRGSGGYSFQFFVPSIPDHMLTDMDQEVETPEFDYGSGYTSAQLAQMRADQEEKIRQLELDIRMAEADYKLMQLEASDGNIYAQVDGVIVSLLNEDEARMTSQPLLKLSGGGGFYIEGTVSELERESLVIGQEVTVSDWNTGMTYTGVIHSVGDFPSQDGYYNGIGNPNVSYFPFRVYVDGSADLQEGRYVSVMYAASDTQQGIYLENPFIRKENGRSYVYVRGADATLEKRYVVTGKALWGSYTEILEGLTAEDYIAFPYGKLVVAGAPTREGDLSELYG